MSRTEVVATGVAQVYRHEKDKKVQIIDYVDLPEKAVRCCRLGSASCGFAGVELSGLTGDGTVTVSTLCNRPENCGTSDDSLQVGLDRLANAR